MAPPKADTRAAGLCFSGAAGGGSAVEQKLLGDVGLGYLDAIRHGRVADRTR